MISDDWYIYFGFFILGILVLSGIITMVSNIVN